MVPDCAVSSPGEANIASACCQSARHTTRGVIMGHPRNRRRFWVRTQSHLGHQLYSQAILKDSPFSLKVLTGQGYARCLPACLRTAARQSRKFRQVGAGRLVLITGRLRPTVQALSAVPVTLSEHFCTRGRQLILSAVVRALHLAATVVDTVVN